MYRFLIVLAVALGVVTLTAPLAFSGSGLGYGYAWVRDDDGDGIPNGQDPDWLRPGDGSGYKLSHGHGLWTSPRVGATAPSGNAYQYRFRQRQADGKSNPLCVPSLRIRQRLRDGSCVQ